MANKAINDLLKYGVRLFQDNFTASGSPNGYNNWSFTGTSSGTGVTPYLTGSDLYGYYNPSWGYFSGNLNRNKENYSLNRAYQISFKQYMQLYTGNTGTIFSEFSLCGNTSYLSGIDGTSGSNPVLGGLALSVNGSQGVCTVKVSNNNTVLYTGVGDIVRGAWYYYFLDLLGNTVNFSYNTTGIKPSTPQHSVTISDKTMVSNSLVYFLAGQSGNVSDPQNGIRFDELKVLSL